MSLNGLVEALKYLDCFGTNFNFYTEKNRKYYTSFGGILSLLSIIIGTLVFIFINLDDFLHDSPNSTTSTAKTNYRNIKFVEEKIWIPWRIRDYDGKTVNFTGLFFPIPYYYQGIRNNTKKSLDLSYTIINYRLCSETSMANNSDSFIIDIELDQLYCIEMDELDMGGSWDSLFINYVEFDLFICKDGIDYDENNKKCRTYEEIIEAANYNNSFEFEIYYPVVHYQPMNKTNPIFVRYTNYFYHLSRFSNKIDRIYLQQYILKDDTGWMIKKEKTFSHWGYLSLSGDSYATGDKRDLMNEGSSSRLYSFNIYLKSDVVYYNRSYKKIFLIVADGLPIVNIIFIFFKLIAKIFKISSGNKKLTELLFENLQENPKKLNNDRFNILKLKQKKLYSEKKINKKENNNNNNSQNNKINNTMSINNNINDASSVQLSSECEKGRFFYNINKKKKFSFNNKKQRYSQVLNNNNKIVINRTLKNNYNINYGNVGVNNNNININIHNSNIGNFANKSNDFSSHLQSSKVNINKKFSTEYKNNNNNINNNNSNNSNNNNNSNYIFKQKERSSSYVQKKLFPYKYYLFSIFIKNIYISKKSIFFTKKFLVVYYFICQLFDISSYLILQKEFQILKSTLMLGKYKALLETRQKINVNDLSFNTDMKECLDSQKFSILGRVKNFKNSN